MSTPPIKNLDFRSATSSSWSVDRPDLARTAEIVSFVVTPPDSFKTGLPQAGLKQLQAAMTLAVGRSSLKFINNEDSDIREEIQHAHHLLISHGGKVSWAATVIFSNQIHVQSPVISSMHMPPPEKVAKENLSRYQVDHVTGKWTGTRGGLADLHYTTIRDLDDCYDDEKGHHVHKSNIVLEDGKPIDPIRDAWSPQQFFTLTLTPETLELLNQFTHQLSFGSDKSAHRTAGKGRTHINPHENLDEIADQLSRNLLHHHHLIELPLELPLTQSEVIELSLFVGEKNDCYHDPHKSPFDCKSKGMTLLSFLDPEKSSDPEPQLVLTSEHVDGRIPTCSYAAVSVKRGKVKHNFGTNPVEIIPLRFFDDEGRPFFEWPLPTPAQKYCETNKIDLDSLFASHKWIQAQGRELGFKIFVLDGNPKNDDASIQPMDALLDGQQCKLVLLRSDECCVWIKSHNDKLTFEVELPDGIIASAASNTFKDKTSKKAVALLQSAFEGQAIPVTFPIKFHLGGKPK